MSQSSADYVAAAEEQPTTDMITPTADDDAPKTMYSKLCGWSDFQGSVMSKGYARVRTSSR